jgi:hypothetical protein
MPAALLDDVVSERKQFGRHFETKRLGGREIDHELDLGRLQDWQINTLRGAR